MKKMLFVLCLMGVVVSLQAQLKFGAKVGLNISTLTGDVEDVKSKVGPLFGVFADYSISDKLSIQPELLFSMQGCKVESVYEDEEGSFDEDFSIKLNYVIVPIMVKFYLVEGLSLQAGPQLGFLTTAKADDEDMKDDVNKFDLGLNIGAGYEMENGLGVGLRYNFGLTNVNKEDYMGDAKNGVFSFALIYRF